MTVIHKDLASGRWFTLSLAQQLGNIGSEVERALSFQERNDKARFNSAYDRMLELFDLSLSDKRWRGAKLREIARLREDLGRLLYENFSEEDKRATRNYFLYFGILAQAR